MQDYLAHRDPKHTAHYTRVARCRSEGLWRLNLAQTAERPQERQATEAGDGKAPTHGANR